MAERGGSGLEAASNRRFLRRWTILAGLMLTLPYLLMTVFGPQGSIYTGIIYNPSDVYLYYSQMLHGSLGEWAFTLYFTSRPEPSLPIFGLFTLLGHVLPGPATPLSLALVFHVSRLVLAILFIRQAWMLYGELLPGRVSRRLALLFLLFTSGLGLYQVIFHLGLRADTLPYDLDVAEGTTFFSLLYSPHFAAVLLLLVVFLRALLRIVRSPSGSWRATAVAAAAAALVSTIHPEKVVYLGFVVTFFLVWIRLSWRLGQRPALKLAQAWLAVLGGIPYTAFVYLATIGNPLLAVQVNQGRRHPPVFDPVYYLLGYGLPALCALSGLPRVLRRPRQAGVGEALLWSMVVANLLLMAIPWKTLDHQTEGLQLAVAALAGRNVVRVIMSRLWRSRGFAGMVRRRVFGYSSRRLRVLSINLILIASSFTVIFWAFGSWRGALTDSGELYLTPDDVAAVSWIRGHLSAADVVTGTPFSTQFVAAYGGPHVPFGQWAFTPDFDAEEGALRAFFRDPRAQVDYLRTRSVGWLYFGPREAQVAVFDPSRLAYLEPVFRQGGTVIYRVRPCLATCAASGLAP